MTKFEIIKQKWIKQSTVSVPGIGFTSLKIDEILMFQTDLIGDKLWIFLATSSGAHMDLSYNHSENDQYKADLAFLENLLYNR